jgi:hypothetical protein
MPGFPLTIGSTLCCFHQAPAQIPPTQKSVAIVGQPVVTATAQIAVIGCTFATAVPQPCVTIRWSLASAKVTVQGQPMLLMPPPGTGPGPGVCLGPAPQGIPEMKINQNKVSVI